MCLLLLLGNVAAIVVVAFVAPGVCHR